MRRLVIFTVLFCLAPVASFGGYCVNAKRGVKTNDMIKRYLTDLADNSSGYAVVGSVGTADDVETGDGIDITAILITENASWDKDSGKPTVIITGAIHGNEWATPEVCIGIAEYLLLNKDNDDPAVDDKGALINEEAVKAAGGAAKAGIVPRLTSIRQLLKTIQVIIIPVLNPEGYAFSQTSEGKQSYYGLGWRPNRTDQKVLMPEEMCYQADGTPYETKPADAEHCFLADYDDTADGGDLEEEEVIVCESIDEKNLRLFEPSLKVASAEMFDAIYNSTNPSRVVCVSGERRVWKAEWSDDEENNTISLDKAKKEGYLRDAYGVDINRNFQYKWDVVSDQKHLFIRTRSPSSRLYRGTGILSEEETAAMEQLVAERNVVALIDYHAGSTQVLYPYAYSTGVRVDKNILGGKNGKEDYEVFREVSEKIASLLNRHDRGDKTIVNYTAAQNYNKTGVGSGVARDCYYDTEGIAAINIEVHDKRYTYKEAEFMKVVPEICKTNVPGAIWFLFWAATLGK
jgi:hypothetical protein